MNQKNSKIPKENWGVHETHCCKKHGCKYGYEDCPVELGLTKQDYACEHSDYMDDCLSLDEIDVYKDALEQIKKLTTNTSNGELFKIHEIVKKALNEKNIR